MNDEVTRLSYKYCVVPLCKNSTKRTPNKIFFCVPRNAKIRKKWCEVMRKKRIKSSTTALHCCENHFNIEEDTSNYIEYNIMKQQGEKVVLKLKPGVLPHIFQCQKRNMPQKKERVCGLKKQRLSLINESLSSATDSANTVQGKTLQRCCDDTRNSTSQYPQRSSNPTTDIIETGTSICNINAFQAQPGSSTVYFFNTDPSMSIVSVFETEPSNSILGIFGSGTSTVDLCGTAPRNFPTEVIETEPCTSSVDVSETKPNIFSLDVSETRDNISTVDDFEIESCTSGADVSEIKANISSLEVSETRDNMSVLNVFEIESCTSTLDVSETKDNISTVDVSETKPNTSCLDLSETKPNISSLDVSETRDNMSVVDVFETESCNSSVDVSETKPNISSLDVSEPRDNTSTLDDYEIDSCTSSVDMSETKDNISTEDVSKTKSSSADNSKTTTSIKKNVVQYKIQKYCPPSLQNIAISPTNVALTTFKLQKSLTVRSFVPRILKRKKKTS